MILKIRNGVIFDEAGNPIGTLDINSQEAERSIELGSEAVPAIEEFIKEVNSGSFKPRQAVKRFEAIIAKYE